MNTRQQISKILLAGKDVNGKGYFLHVTNCFSIDKAIKYIKHLKRSNKRNRGNCYVIEQRDVPVCYCLPYEFAVRKY